MKVFKDFDLTHFNSYRVKAICARAFFPEREEDFVEIYGTDAERQKILLGSGHNVVLSKSYYDVDFIIVGELFSNHTVENGSTIIADAGADMRRLSEIACMNSLGGLEVFFDIPSSLGGAVVMNAGASGAEIKDVLRQVRYLDLVDLTFKEVETHSINFEYRNSFFQRNTGKIVVKGWLNLNKGDMIQIRQKMETLRAARWLKQPKDLPNAGSVFKRPKGYFVGELIDRLGLKGFTIGGAKISEKHGGFIVNYNGATGADIVALIEHVKEQVLNHVGVDLEIEQRII